MLVDGDKIPLNMQIIMDRYYNSMFDIFRNNNYIFFIKFDIEISDISGIIYETEFSYSFCWNGSNYILLDNYFYMKKIKTGGYLI
jgi:hypothetical protein